MFESIYLQATHDWRLAHGFPTWPCIPRFLLKPDDYDAHEYDREKYEDKHRVLTNHDLTLDQRLDDPRHGQGDK